jgi:hypothetical protein
MGGILLPARHIETRRTGCRFVVWLRGRIVAPFLSTVEYSTVSTPNKPFGGTSTKRSWQICKRLRTFVLIVVRKLRCIQATNDVVLRHVGSPPAAERPNSALEISLTVSGESVDISTVRVHALHVVEPASSGVESFDLRLDESCGFFFVRRICSFFTVRRVVF